MIQDWINFRITLTINVKWADIALFSHKGEITCGRVCTSSLIGEPNKLDVQTLYETRNHQTNLNKY